MTTEREYECRICCDKRTESHGFCVCKVCGRLCCLWCSRDRPGLGGRECGDCWIQTRKQQATKLAEEVAW